MTYVILQGNCLDVLKTIPSGIIQTCVTSPPYFGLRDYGTASWEGGSSECSHRAPDEAGQTTKPSAGQREHAGRFAGSNCYQCGAKRIDSQIGLEPTPQAYVDSLVQVFRGVRRVLRDDGTLWLNLGDSYARSAEKGGSGPNGKNEHRWAYGAAQNAKIGSSDKAVGPADRSGSRSIGDGLKPKDLIGIPWRVAFALQQDGWYLRQDIIWHKPNPMPESVRDRCTKAHEYIFLLSKSEKYFFDADAIKEPSIYAPGKTKEVEREQGYYGGKWSEQGAGGRNDKSFKAIRETRNKRSVWTVTPKPFKEAHFATFPPDLIQPCILAGAPVGKLVLDPFGGAGTTALVCEQFGRPSISIELNPAYVAMARARVEASRPLPIAAE